MEYVKSFRDLEAYKLSRQLSREIFERSKKFPKEEMYSLTDQIRRSSSSVGGSRRCGTEAWAKRNYEKHFVSKLTDADGEQLETQHWIETALDCFYISNESANNLLERYFTVGKMLNSMMEKADKFCKKPLNN
ncbi:MAG: four helix bundle protein [Bacteroidales bacterium]|nr:four helix bundle protein [Bacteroidales bacterium]